MFSKDSPAEYLERAEMHEQLAAATDDIPARKMHLAMAAAYRSKAAELGGIQIIRPSSMDQTLKMNIAAR